MLGGRVAHVHGMLMSMLTSMRAFQTDEELVHNLSPDTVLAYCSGQRVPGGDWGNLVVLQSPTPHQGIAAFRTHNPPHARAVGDIAPRYYQSVRIHALQVRQAWHSS
jgi:hypothetical protein